MINDVTSSTRYRRRTETTNILEYIHGGKEAAIYGAWDYLTNAVGSTYLENLLLKFKRGKFIEKLHGKFNKAIEKSDISVKKLLQPNICHTFHEESTILYVPFKNKHSVLIPLRVLYLL